MKARRRTKRDIMSAKAVFSYRRPFRASVPTADKLSFGNLSAIDPSAGFAHYLKTGNSRAPVFYARRVLRRGSRFRSIIPPSDSTLAGMKTQMRAVRIASGRQILRGLNNRFRTRLYARSGGRGAFAKGHAFFGNQYVKLGGAARRLSPIGRKLLSRFRRSR